MLGKDDGVGMRLYHSLAEATAARCSEGEDMALRRGFQVVDGDEPGDEDEPGLIMRFRKPGTKRELKIRYENGMFTYRDGDKDPSVEKTTKSTFLLECWLDGL